MKKDNEKLFSAPRWTEIPQAKVVGERTLTEEEVKEAQEIRKKIIKRKINNKGQKHLLNDKLVGAFIM